KMALDSSEERNFSLNYEEIVHLQAIFRGALVRKQFNDIKKEYRSIVCDIEETDQCEVIWPTKHLAPPIVRRKRLKKRKNNLHSKETNGEEPDTKINQHQQDNSRKEDNTEILPGSNGKLGVFSDVCIQTGASLELVQQPNDGTQHLDLGETNSNEPITRSDNIRLEPEMDRDVNKHHDTVNLQRKFECDIEQFEPPTHDSPQSLPKEIIAGSELKPSCHPHCDASVSHRNNEKTENDQMKVTFNDTSLMQDTNVDISKDSINQVQPFASSTPKHVPPSNSNTKEAVSTHSSVELTKDPPRRISQSAIDGTSVWDSASFEDMSLTTNPKDKVQLEQLRSNIAMELLWVQQAISSRKNYLRLKNKMSGES
ncbi:unnamed protein product, partial [Owenia fusiformis]